MNLKVAPKIQAALACVFSGLNCNLGKVDRLKMMDIRLSAVELAEAIVAQCPKGADRSAAIRKVREAVAAAEDSLAISPGWVDEIEHSEN